MKKKLKARDRGLLIAIVAGFLLMLAMELFRDRLIAALPMGESVYTVSVRLVGGAVCVCLMIYCSFSDLLKFSGHRWGALLAVLPCFLIAVDNFPFLSVAMGDAAIHAGAGEILRYALVCLSVGFFEETAFRGCVFTMIYSRRKKNAFNVFLSVVLSSAVFGAIHLVNLFTGASVGSVLLQVGYSFLIGGMCSVMLLKTHNIWYCVILHALYNFAGGVVPECGSGTIWTVPTVILTVCVSVPVAVYVLALLFRLNREELSLAGDERERDGAEEPAEE